MQTADRVALVLLGVLWSGGFLFTRIAVPAFGPLALVDLRVLIAGLVLLLWVVARGELPPFWRRWREYLVLGALNVALPFTLIAWAALTLPASLGSILMATVPLFTAPIAAIQLNERVSGRQAAGLIVGFIGVGILVGLRPLSLTPAFAAAVSALLGAAALYALGGVYTARRFTGASPVESTIGQQFGAFVLLLPFALAAPPRAWPPALGGRRAADPCRVQQRARLPALFPAHHLGRGHRRPPPSPTSSRCSGPSGPSWWPRSGSGWKRSPACS